MADLLKVEVKDAKRAFFKLRGRFIKLQRTIVAGALIEAAEPIDRGAEADAPVRSGELRGSINPALVKKGTFARLRVIIGPGRRLLKGRYQELGFKATGRATRAAADNPRFIPGKHYLRTAGARNSSAAERIFASRVIKGFEEIQDAGEAIGIV
jgi:hypothetical protein